MSNKNYTPKIIATHFFKQYKDFIETGQFFDPFTEDQIHSILSSIRNDPENMIIFFNQTFGYLRELLKEELYSEEVIAECMTYFGTSLTGIFVPLIGIALQTLDIHVKTSNKKKSDSPTLDDFDDVLNEKGSNSIHTDAETLFKNLDFDMPNWDNLDYDK